MAPPPVQPDDVQVDGPGMGISPPTVSLAFSPDTADTVGSARTLVTPYRSKACSVALRVLAGFCAVSAVAVPFCAAVAKGLTLLTGADAMTPLIGNGLNCVNVPQLAVSELVVIPSCLAMLRSISATVTFNIT